MEEVWSSISPPLSLSGCLLVLLASPSVTTFNISVFGLRPVGKYWQSGSEWKTFHFCCRASEMSFPHRRRRLCITAGSLHEDGEYSDSVLRLQAPPINKNHCFHFFCLSAHWLLPPSILPEPSIPPLQAFTSLFIVQPLQHQACGRIMTYRRVCPTLNTKWPWRLPKLVPPWCNDSLHPDNYLNKWQTAHYWSSPPTKLLFCTIIAHPQSLQIRSTSQY